MKDIGLSQNLKAFTLAELLVAMVLSTLVIALGYWVLHGMERSIHSDHSRQEIARDFLIFRIAFEKDALESETLIWNGEVFLFNKENGTKVTYRIVNDSITRESDNYTDVFHPAFRYMEIETINEQSLLVQKINFRFQPDSTLTIPYSYIKQYSANILFNEELKKIKESESLSENHQIR